jgi:hypothetical protein
VEPEQTRQNLLALRRAEARRPRTPGITRSFVVLRAGESVPDELSERGTRTMRIPRFALPR